MGTRGRRRYWGQGDSALVDPFTQEARGLEGYYPPGIQNKGVAGLWIAASPWFFVPDIELAKTTEQQVIALDE